jgi:hypothetical protein
MVASFMSPEQREKREADLAAMRLRFQRQPRSRKGKPTKRKPRKSRRVEPRSPLAKAILELSKGDCVWLPTNSVNALALAVRHKRMIATRTAYKNGVKGVRVWLVRKPKAIS